MPWWRVLLISVQAGLAYGWVTRGSNFWAVAGGVLFVWTLIQIRQLEDAK